MPTKIRILASKREVRSDVFETDGQTKRQPLLFLSVGALNTLLDFAFYTFLTLVVFKEVGDIALAGFISGTFALVCAFITHGLITFKGSNLGRETMIRFILFTGLGMWILRPLLLSLFIMIPVLYSLVRQFTSAIGLPFSLDFISRTGAFGFMVIIILLYNYYVYSRYVFLKPLIDTDLRTR